jgi:hypothetical protein
MYDVLVYKMLWDWKKTLNISLWKIIRLSMRPATGMCPHISLQIILIYIVLDFNRYNFFQQKRVYHCHPIPLFENTPLQQA